MHIRPISFGSFKSQQSQRNQKNSPSSDMKKVLPLAIALSLPASGVMTSCIDNNKNSVSAGWLSVAVGRLDDEQIENINKTRRAPKNTVFKKIDETTTVSYKDSEGNTQTKEVETGGWHYELVNNKSGIETGTTVLPEGYTVVKNVFGFVEIVEDGTSGIFIKNKNAKSEAKKRDTIENRISYFSVATGILSDEQVEKINKTRVVPEGTIIVKTEDGEYELENNRLGWTEGTRLMPEGYEMRKNVLGVAEIVPIDQKSIFLKDKDTTSIPEMENNMKVGFLEAQTCILTEEQVEMINKTGRMPEGMLIAKDMSGKFYVTGDLLNVTSGTRTLPKGYEVKRNMLGFAIVVPVGTKGILIGE